MFSNIINMKWIQQQQKKKKNSNSTVKPVLKTTSQETASRSTMSILLYIRFNCLKEPPMLIDQWPLKSRLKSDPTFAVKQKKGI